MISTVLAFFVTLGVLIVVHECGHFLAARAFGVRVLRFSLGFGPVLWSRQRRPESTEFALSAIPFGGYVLMLDEREEPVPAADLPHALSSKPLWQRMAVVLAGPLANLILAVGLYTVAHWIGIDEPKAVIAAPDKGSAADSAGLVAGSWVRAWSKDGEEWHDVRSLSDLRWQVMQSVLQAEDLRLLVSDRDGRSQRRVTLGLRSIGADELDAATLRRIGIGGPYSDPVLGDITAGGAGAAAGLRSGDRVLAVDDRRIDDSAQLRELVRGSGSGASAVPMRWQIERQGARSEIVVTPAISTDGGKRIGRLEIVTGQRPEMVTVSYGFVDGISSAFTQTWQTSALTLKMIGRIITGRASLKNLSGPVSIADYAGQSARLGFVFYLSFLAAVSISLGIINLLPLPVLDGGQLMYYLFEAVTGSPVTGLWLRRLQQSGLVVIVAMMSLALYNDVTRLMGQQ